MKTIEQNLNETVGTMIVDRMVAESAMTSMLSNLFVETAQVAEVQESTTATNRTKSEAVHDMIIHSDLRI